MNYNTAMLDIKVPNINERKRIPMEAIQAVVNRIAEKFNPDKIILFGSYAYGDPKPWSDVDLLVVMDTSLTPNQQRRAISRALAPKPFAMDIIIRSRRDLEERIPLGDWFLKEIVERGKLLYERTR
jgi:predicted nucleotidyltransferase